MAGSGSDGYRMRAGKSEWIVWRKRKRKLESGRSEEKQNDKWIISQEVGEVRKVRGWTEGQLRILERSWGKQSLNQLARRLGKSPTNISNKAIAMGLGYFAESVDGVTISHLSQLIGVKRDLLLQWSDHFGFPAKRRRFGGQWGVWVVDIRAFWKWAEKHKHLINFARIEDNILPPEPSWVKEERRRDILASQKYNDHLWADLARDRLRELCEYTTNLSDLERKLGRSREAIAQEMLRMGIKPRRNLNYKVKKWTKKEVQIMMQMRKKGLSWRKIARRLSRTEKSCRAKAAAEAAEKEMDQGRRSGC